MSGHESAKCPYTVAHSPQILHVTYNTQKPYYTSEKVQLRRRVAHNCALPVPPPVLICVCLMRDPKYDSTEEILKDPSGDVAKVRKMGITDFAIITYVMRVQEGQTREKALAGILHGRSLSGAQIAFVRQVLARFPIPRAT